MRMRCPWSELRRLPEAIGPAGTTFAWRDVADIAAKIGVLLSDESALARFRAAADAHLINFTGESVARRYLDVLKEAGR